MSKDKSLPLSVRLKLMWAAVKIYRHFRKDQKKLMQEELRKKRLALQKELDVEMGQLK